LFVVNCELDSHADTCCFGRRNVFVLSHDLNHEASVSGFLPSFGSVPTPIASVAVAYDDPVTFTTYILIFHQSLLFDDLPNNLLCPFQLRLNDVVVNDTPLSVLVRSTHYPNLHATDHSIIISDPPLHIPLYLRGVMSYFESRRPTLLEMENPQTYPQITMTYDSPEWDPYDCSLARVEQSLRTNLDLSLDTPPPRVIPAVFAHLACISSVFSADFLPSLTRLTRFIDSSTTSVRRKGTVTAADLARRWHIGLDAAQRTIDRTTQLGVRDYSHSLGTRRLRHSTQQLKYRRLNSVVYTDTMFSGCRSLQQNTCAQVYVTPFEWTRVYPIKSKKDAHLTLDLLHHQYGVFHTIIPDNARELTQKDFLDKARRAGSIIHPVEAYTPNQNRAESSIRELKRMYRRAMVASSAPRVLWDHCFELQALIRSHTALDMLSLAGDVPETMLLGDTTDISNLCQFAWYEFVWHIDPRDSLDKRKLGRWLGPSHSVGDAMCYKVLNSTGLVLVRSSVLPLSTDDMNSEVVKQKMEEFTSYLAEHLGIRMAGLPVADDDDILLNDAGETTGLHADQITPEFAPYGDDNINIEPMMPEADDMDHDAYDKYISARLMLPDASGIVRSAQVKRRKRDEDGNLIGHSHSNPILDTGLYEVEFEDGQVGTYAANVIAENIYEQLDDEGFAYTLFDSIDHKRGPDAVAADDGFTEYHGRRVPKRTTRGWKLCVRWKDDSTSWIPLKDLKESHPVQVAEYAVANKLVSEPAFNWWVKTVLRRRDRIIKAVKTRYQRCEQKFGLELPKTVKRALEIDEETGTTYWCDAIRKEMKTVFPAFEFLDEGAVKPIGY
jgi:hypothetical protein